MKRREFISLLGGAATWPLAAHAQQGGRVRRVVFLHALAENDPEVKARIAAFRQGLETLGWVENRNIQVEHRLPDDREMADAAQGDRSRRQADNLHVQSTRRAVVSIISTRIWGAPGVARRRAIGNTRA